jgi:isopentenyl-diphosphate delta-isomerase
LPERYISMLSTRKDDHLRICLEEAVRPPAPGNGLGEYRFVHQALPEIDLTDIDLCTTFLGKDLCAPLLVSSMTGGALPAKTINRRLAQAANLLGVAMGVGSQRAALEDAAWAETFRVRDVAPDILLMANLGAIQLVKSYTVEHCQRAVDMVGADALVLHLNPLQEALQPGGDTHFGGLLRRVEAVCRALPVPVVVKEVGFGLSAEVAAQLVEAGVSALDVAGAGGTSWSEVERHRTFDPVEDQIAGQFADWGIPTAECLRMIREILPHVPTIASGGIETGIDVAKCVALGADLVGIAWPLLRPALLSDQDVVNALETIVEVLRIAMFCIGARDIRALRRTRHLRRL